MFTVKKNKIENGHDCWEEVNSIMCMMFITITNL